MHHRNFYYLTRLSRTNVRHGTTEMYRVSRDKPSSSFRSRLTCLASLPQCAHHRLTPHVSKATCFHSQVRLLATSILLHEESVAARCASRSGSSPLLTRAFETYTSAPRRPRSLDSTPCHNPHSTAIAGLAGHSQTRCLPLSALLSVALLSSTRQPLAGVPLCVR